MLVKVDASALEWRVKTFLANDSVAKTEITNNEDIHSNNVKAFGFTGANARTTSKVYAYRMIFANAFGPQGCAGPAYAYANDPLFMGVSTSVKYWTKVCEKFFEKYQGIKEHSLSLIRTAIETGCIVSPSGRFYSYSQKTDWRGDRYWPVTEILNHIVQGLSADLMVLCRLLAFKRIKQQGWGDKVLLINTVHDDIEVDCINDMETVWEVCCLLESCFADIPRKFELDYGTKIDVPMAGECKFGWTLFEEDMKKFKHEEQSFTQDWKILLDKKSKSVL